MEQINFYDMDYEIQKIMLEGCNGDKGKIISKTEGVCGDIYIFDHGENTTPRYVCAKTPKNIGDLEETASRFAKEIETQLSFGRHQYVHWIFDFGEVVGAPIAFFRYWGSDLKKLINDNSICDIKKLSVMAYACSGLMHCYRNGLTSHQDLKPANIFLRDLTNDFVGLPDLPIYTSALIGDFGLANASIDSNVFEGSRPYMAPEQWNKEPLSSKTDVFALGVILCELFTNGYHPVGIKLGDYWPKPIGENSKKWTGTKPWKSWVKKEDKVDKSILTQLPSDIKDLISSMLSTSISLRPSIEEVLEELLSITNSLCPESYNQINFQINYHNQKAHNKPLKEYWPYLFIRWNKFEEKFASGI